MYIYIYLVQCVYIYVCLIQIYACVNIDVWYDVYRLLGSYKRSLGQLCQANLHSTLNWDSNWGSLDNLRFREPQFGSEFKVQLDYDNSSKV